MRTCPGCGSDAATPEVHSDRPAERLPFAEARRLWTGLFKERVFFSYARCAACGLLYAPTFFTPAQLSTLYAAMAPNMADVGDDLSERTQRGYFDVAMAAGPPAGGYLEVGADVGHVVALAARQERFDRLWLVEPNHLVHPQLVSAVAGRPHMITADGDLAAVPDASVGLAVLVHVLDHLLDPAAMLAGVRSKLRPGGVLLIVVHNEASLLRRLLGRRWPPFCLQHPQVYSPASITRLVAAAEFGGVAVGPSRNYFTVDFLARQAAWTVGVALRRLPWLALPLGLRLGNIIVTARR